MQGEDFEIPGKCRGGGALWAGPRSQGTVQHPARENHSQLATKKERPVVTLTLCRVSERRRGVLSSQVNLMMFKIYSRYIWDIFEQPGETDGISIRYISSLWMVKLDRRQREERSFEEHLHHLPLSHRHHDQNHRRQLVNMIFTHPCMPWLWKAEERSRWVSSPRGLRSRSKKFSPRLMNRSLMASRLNWSTY